MPHVRVDMTLPLCGPNGRRRPDQSGLYSSGEKQGKREFARGRRANPTPPSPALGPPLPDAERGAMEFPP
jgi:hypothetical protein